MIPVDAQLSAPPGHLLVERAELPVRRGKIYVAPNTRWSTRSSQAVVVSVGEGLGPEWSIGEHVILSTNVGRSVRLGLRDERVLYRVSPSAILAGLDPEFVAAMAEEDQPGVDNRGESLRPVPAWEVEERTAIDEGSPEALR